MYGLEEVCTQVNGLRISGIRVSAVYMTIHMYVSYEEKWTQHGKGFRLTEVSFLIRRGGLGIVSGAATEPAEHVAKAGEVAF